MNFWRLTRLKYLYPIILLLLILIDGAVYLAFDNFLVIGSFQFIPMIFLTWIAFVAMFNDDDDINYYLWLVIAGVFFGIYYLGYSGIFIYLIGFLVFGAIIKNFPRPNSGLFYNFFIFIISLVIYLYLTYGLGRFLSIAATSFLDQTIYLIAPVLIINAIFFFILYVPFQRLVIWADDSHNDLAYNRRRVD